MKKEELFELMPTKVVKENEVNEEITEQHVISKNGKSFVSALSINRYLDTKLVDFNIEERLNLFSNLSDIDFTYYENDLHFNGIDTESFIYLLDEEFKLTDEYELDNFYIRNLLKGKDITDDKVKVYEEHGTINVRFGNVLETLIFSTGGMHLGDAPTIGLMLTVKKALLGAYLAEENIKSLQSGKREIYNISILE